MISQVQNISFSSEFSRGGSKRDFSGPKYFFFLRLFEGGVVSVISQVKNISFSSEFSRGGSKRDFSRQKIFLGLFGGPSQSGGPRRAPSAPNGKRASVVDATLRQRDVQARMQWLRGSPFSVSNYMFF